MLSMFVGAVTISMHETLQQIQLEAKKQAQESRFQKSAKELSSDRQLSSRELLE